MCISVHEHEEFEQVLETSMYKIISIIPGTIREAPRQMWRFKEDFSGGNDALSASESL